MTEATHTPLPEQQDGEPDLAAEIARLDEALKSIAANTAAMDQASDYDAMSASLDEILSEDARKKLPTTGSKIDQLFARVIAAVAEQKARPVVPETDTSKPALTTAAPDFSSLPAHARIARGYR